MQLEQALAAAKRVLKIKQEEELPPQLKQAVTFAQNAMIRCLQQKMTEYDVLLLCAVHSAYGVTLTEGESADSTIEEVATAPRRGRPLGSKNRTLQEVAADG